MSDPRGPRHGISYHIYLFFGLLLYCFNRPNLRIICFLSLWEICSGWGCSCRVRSYTTVVTAGVGRLLSLHITIRH